MKEIWDISGLCEAHRQRLLELAGDLDIAMTDGEGLRLEVCSGAPAVRAERTAQGARLCVQRDGQLARAAGLLAEGCEEAQKPVWNRLELMWDCSRNAVPNFEGFKKMARRLALMGYTGIQLYTEDTYELENYPYFGYMRGRYTADELREMDRYAAMLGLELVPCIQTLAHLNQPMRWPAFRELRDCGDILLADCEGTYELIEEMVRTMADCLKSRRINIGMDEAHMLGLGKYLDLNGYHNRMDIMLRHFNRVMEIVRRYGYEPMMWSDMFYRLLSGGEYYAENVELSEEARARIPDDVTLVYWDYYSLEGEKYDRMLKSHKKMCGKVAFAGGAWTWAGLSPNNRFSIFTSGLAAAACVEHGVTDVIVTAWGDDGAETPVFDVLPTLQYWAEWRFTGAQPSQKTLESRFAACTGGSFSNFMLLDAASTPPDNAAPGVCGATPSRYLTYQDLLIGLCDGHVREDYPAYYQRASEELALCAQRSPRWSLYFQTQSALCSLIASKARAGVEIREAYRAGDRAALAAYAEPDGKIDVIRRRLEEYASLFRRQWMQDNKVFGLEVIEQRLGGLTARLCFAQERLRSYLSGETGRLEELEAKTLPFNGDIKGHSEQDVLKYTAWKDIITACVVSD